MSTSQTKSILSELRNGEPIPPHTQAYFQERLKNRLHGYILRKFMEEERAGRLTKAALARRMGKRPEIVTRLIGAPGNWTLDTVSDLLLGIAAEELEPASSSLLNRRRRNYSGIDWSVYGLDVANIEFDKNDADDGRPTSPTKSDSDAKFEFELEPA